MEFPGSIGGVFIPWPRLKVADPTAAAAAAKSLQSCLTLCVPIDSSPPGSPVPGILQARTLEWVAISFSNAWKWKVKVKLLSCVLLLATLWTAAYQAPLSMGFSRQEYWSGVRCLLRADPTVNKISALMKVLCYIWKEINLPGSDNETWNLSSIHRAKEWILGTWKHTGKVYFRRQRYKVLSIDTERGWRAPKRQGL